MGGWGGGADHTAEQQSPKKYALVTRSRREMLRHDNRQDPLPRQRIPLPRRLQQDDPRMGEYSAWVREGTDEGVAGDADDSWRASWYVGRV